MNPTSDSDKPVQKLRREFETPAALKMHITLFHNIYVKSVHDTYESDRECHETDHIEHFSTGWIPHEHVINVSHIDDSEEWTWQ
jgi:hypothetical protein